jgi:hypothetical protein
VASVIRRGRNVAATVFLAVLVVRGAYVVSLSRTPFASWRLWTETDEHAYIEWSAHLAAGNWADVPAYRAYFNWQRAFGPPETWERWYRKNAYYAGPLYPYGLAALRLFFGSPVWPARILQLLLACLASAVLALSVFGLGKGKEEDFLRDEREKEESRWAAPAAIVAGLAYGLYGPLVFHDGFLLRDGPVAHLSTLLLVWPVVTRERASTRGALLLGLLGGVAILLKQTIAPLALASLFAYSSSPSRNSSGGAQRRRRVFLVGVLGLALPIGALAARNISAGVPPLTFDTRQAIGLAWGNAFGADATTNPPPAMTEILEEAAGSTSKTARLVLESYRDAPLDFARLLAKKFATFWNAFEVPDNANFYFFRDRIRILRMLPVFSCLLGVGLVGLYAALSRGVLRREEALLALVAILTPLAACILVQTTSRYRVAMAGPLALGAGLFLLFAFKEIQARRFRTVGLLALTAGALSLVPLLPSTIPAGRHRFADSMIYATLLEGEGDRAGAAREVRRYLEEGTDDSARDAGVASLRNWYETGDRSGTLVAPEGIAPPDRRVRKTD